jgi:hypothetical protein
MDKLLVIEERHSLFIGNALKNDAFEAETHDEGSVTP